MAVRAALRRGEGSERERGRPDRAADPGEVAPGGKPAPRPPRARAGGRRPPPAPWLHPGTLPRRGTEAAQRTPSAAIPTRPGRGPTAGRGRAQRRLAPRVPALAGGAARRARNTWGWTWPRSLAVGAYCEAAEQALTDALHRSGGAVQLRVASLKTFSASAHRPRQASACEFCAASSGSSPWCLIHASEATAWSQANTFSQTSKTHLRLMRLGWTPRLRISAKRPIALAHCGPQQVGMKTLKVMALPRMARECSSARTCDACSHRPRSASASQPTCVTTLGRRPARCTPAASASAATHSCPRAHRLIATPRAMMSSRSPAPTHAARMHRPRDHCSLMPPADAL
mmetsp:Transcript_16457/g.52637  ORF Transcript_16457/g.52637 Transcript_16457/m.52637 type:complete len:343 (+) Transcript_16457:136-1164(+)